MNLLKSIIVDDEPRGLSSMQKLLELNCPEVAVMATCSSADDALQKIAQLQPQLVFLDVAMPGKSGLQMLEELRDLSFEVIMVTAHSDFMIEAFHFSAVDYLLKPVEEELLVAAVRRAGKRIGEKMGSQNIEAFLHNIRHRSAGPPMRLCLPSQKGFQVVELGDIVYAEAAGNYTNFHFAARHPVCTSKAINEYEDLLEDAGFVRIHKSFLINLQHVKEYLRGEGGSVRMAGGQELEVSRRRKDLFLGKMREYFKY